MGQEHGDIHWTELNTREPEKAKAFFEKICGWSVDAVPMPDGGTYHIAKKGDHMVAGIFTMDGPDFEGTPPHWMTYIAVDDVDATCEAVAANGGVVVTPPFDVPMAGRIAMIKDPSGAVVGIMTP